MISLEAPRRARDASAPASAAAADSSCGAISNARKRSSNAASFSCAASRFSAASRNAAAATSGSTASGAHPASVPSSSLAIACCGSSAAASRRLSAAAAGSFALARSTAELAHRWTTGAFELVVLDGATHWLPEQAPDVLAEVVLSRVLERVYSEPPTSRPSAS